MANLNPAGPLPTAQPPAAHPPLAQGPTPGTGPPQAGPSGNAPQGQPAAGQGPIQGKPSWWRKTLKWNWTERAQWIAIITLITGITYGAVSWISSDQQAAIAKWEAEKEYYLYCQSLKDSNAKLPADCSLIVDRGLPPPPFHSPNFFRALGSLGKRGLGLTTDPGRVGGIETIRQLWAVSRLYILTYTIVRSYIVLGRTTMILQKGTISVLSAALWLRVRGACEIYPLAGFGVRQLWVFAQSFVGNDRVLSGAIPKTVAAEKSFGTPLRIQLTQRGSFALRIVQTTDRLLGASPFIGESVLSLCYLLTLTTYVYWSILPLLLPAIRLVTLPQFFSTDMLYALLHLDFGISQVGMIMPWLVTVVDFATLVAKRASRGRSGEKLPDVLQMPLSLVSVLGVDRQKSLLHPGVGLSAYGLAVILIPVSPPAFCEMLGMRYGFGVGIAVYGLGTVLIGFIMKGTCILVAEEIQDE